MKNKITITADGIIEVLVVGNQTRDSVMAMGDEVGKALERLKAQGKPGLIIDDLTQLGQTDTPSRQAVNQLARTLPFERVAMLAQPSTLMRVGTKLLLQAIGMGGKIKYFEDREQAMRWLKDART